MSILSLYCRYTASLIIFVAGSVAIVNMALAGSITYPTDSYTTGDTLTASDLNAKFNEIKGAVNDNNNKKTLNDLSCTDGQIAKWNDSASIWECGDVAGVAFAEGDSTFQNLTTVTSVIQSVSISAPGPGYIIVSFSAIYRLGFTKNVSDFLEVGISDQSNDNIGSLNSRRLISISNDYASGDVYGSVATQRVFHVTSGGPQTYYVLGHSNQTSPVNTFGIANPATQAVFVPNGYPYP